MVRDDGVLAARRASLATVHTNTHNVRLPAARLVASRSKS